MLRNMKNLIRLVRPYQLCARSLVSWRCRKTSLDLRSNCLTQLPTVSKMEQQRFYCENPSANSFHVQDYDDFKERVLNSETPVVVDFFAEYCILLYHVYCEIILNVKNLAGAVRANFWHLVWNLW